MIEKVKWCGKNEEYTMGSGWPLDVNKVHDEFISSHCIGASKLGVSPLEVEDVNEDDIKKN